MVFLLKNKIYFLKYDGEIRNSLDDDDDCRSPYIYYSIDKAHFGERSRRRERLDGPSSREWDETASAAGRAINCFVLSDISLGWPTTLLVPRCNSQYNNNKKKNFFFRFIHLCCPRRVNPFWNKRERHGLEIMYIVMIHLFYVLERALLLREHDSEAERLMTYLILT